MQTEVLPDSCSIAAAPLRGALNLRETATYLGVSVITVRRLVKRGLIRPNRALRIPMFVIRELEAFLSDPTNKKSRSTLPPQNRPGTRVWEKAVANSPQNKPRGGKAVSPPQNTTNTK